MKIVERAIIESFTPDGAVNLVRRRYVVYDDPTIPEDIIQGEFRRAAMPGDFDLVREFVEFTGDCAITNPEVESEISFMPAMARGEVSQSRIMAQIELHWTPKMIDTYKSKMKSLQTDQDTQNQTSHEIS